MLLKNDKHHAETQVQELYACKRLMQTKRRKYISANTCKDRKGDFNSTTQQRRPVQQRTAHWHELDHVASHVPIRVLKLQPMSFKDCTLKSLTVLVEWKCINQGFPCIYMQTPSRVCVDMICNNSMHLLIVLI